MADTSTVYFPDPGKKIHSAMKVAAAIGNKKLGDWTAEALKEKAEADQILFANSRKFSEVEEV